MNAHTDCGEGGQTALEQTLRQELTGEVRFDRASRVLYSTDASIYRIEPSGVVLPKSRQDVIAIVRAAGRYGMPVIPRGGGTGLAGQSVGSGLVMDFSRFMNRILEVNAHERWARVEPGVVLDELNAHLKPMGLQFAPDVATGSRANVGGMIANNSAGAHSVIYGKTIDHVRSLDVVLSDGSEVVLEEVDDHGLRRKQAQRDLEGRIYRDVMRISADNRQEIQRRYPRILRRVGGYNLDEFTDRGTQNLCRMVVGSEGTLASVVEAQLNLVPLPAAKVLGVIQFQDLVEAMEAVTAILDTGPAAVELIDRLILDQTRGSISLSSQRGWVAGDPEAVLVVEYYGGCEAEVVAKLGALEARVARAGIGYAFHRATSPSEQANVWNVRKAGLGLLMGIKGDAKPVAFVEDAAVSPEKLPGYIQEFDALVRAHGTTAGYYAHASVGLLHIRPLVNLKTGVGVDRMRSIAEGVRDLVLKYGGAMSGEHGDGLVRSCWNERIFGRTLYQAFRQVKRAFDPDGLMNPGKIVDAVPMTENLRIGPQYVAEEPNTRFDFSADGGFARAVEMCNGVGACRKKLEGTMCPTYMATLEEEHSTRGRANALRAAISGQWEGGLADRRLHDVLDLCLECKACKSECPSNVDMAKLKYEFLSHYYEAHGTPFRAWLFANVEALNHVGSLFAPLSNRLMGSSFGRASMRALGIAPGRSLPPFVRRTFSDWFHGRQGLCSSRKVALFNDTYLNYNYPSVGVAAVLLMEAAGFEVLLPDKKCCGRPMLSSGMIDQVKQNLAYNVRSLYPLVEQGVWIVGVEPSCVSMLTDDYPDLTADPRARALAEHTCTVETFLGKVLAEKDCPVRYSQLERRILLHGHCHQKSLWGTDDVLRLLNLPPGYSATMIDSGCCGMAGSFGYEAEHYDVSLQVGEDRLLAAIRQAPVDVAIATAGVSCRQQILHATGRQVMHPAELVWEAVETGDTRRG